LLRIVRSKGFKHLATRATTVPRMNQFHLAQLNLAVLRAPLDAPMMTEFVMLLDPVNALADRAPGFVWRHRPLDAAVAVCHRGERDELILNLSVWEDIESLRAFTYSGSHLHVMRRRKVWFKRMSEMSVVLWWIPASHRPTIDEGLERLDQIRRIGPTPSAFSMKQPFAPPVHALAVLRKSR
jgi:hypothetical protein